MGAGGASGMSSQKNSSNAIVITLCAAIFCLLTILIIAGLAPPDTWAETPASRSTSSRTQGTTGAWGSSRASSSSSASSRPVSSSSSYSSRSTAFTNRFGTPTTICNHTGCNNYIASSGDTNCCTTHSKKCAECGCYVDEDALWCMSCIEKAIDQIQGK